MNFPIVQTEFPVLFDGATGTEYQSRGLKPGEPPEKLTLIQPEIVPRVHRDYVAAVQE